MNIEEMLNRIDKIESDLGIEIEKGTYVSHFKCSCYCTGTRYNNSKYHANNKVNKNKIKRRKARKYH